MSFFKKLKKESEFREDSPVTPKELKAKEKVSEKTAHEQEKRAIEHEKTEIKKISVTTSSKKVAADWLRAKGQLAIDAYQTDSDFCVQAPIAGIEAADVDITIENGMLVIRGERKAPEQETEKKYIYQECYWGAFSRQIILPEDVDLEKISASLRKGILTVKIPRTKARTKKVVISVEE